VSLVGRIDQRAELRRLAAEADVGRPGIAVLFGEPGQGKTALLDELAAEARRRGATVLSATGAEFESELPFGALSCLLTPLFGHLPELTERQSQSIRAAVGAETGGEAGLQVFSATHALVRAAARVGTVVMLVDDAHWIDRSSLDALLFCARRLEHERVAVVFATRDDARFRDAGLSVTTLGGRPHE